jgi:PAS domain S-box-containing protein
LDLTGDFLFLSPSFNTTLGYRDEDTRIRNALEMVHPDDIPATWETIQSSIEHPDEIHTVELRIRHADGSWRNMDVIGKVSSWGGHDRVIILNGRDITGRKRAEEQLSLLLNEKEILLSEIHHRVRNTIQLAVSMMKMQIRRENDERVREALLGTQNRLNAIAATFDMLYYSEDMSRVNLRKIITSIVGSIQSSFEKTREHPIQSDIRIDILEMGVDLALPLALVTSELVTNAFENAFPDGRSGMVTVSGSKDEQGQMILTVSDNGSGLPVGFDHAESGTTGFTLVHALIQQIDGNLRYESSGKGTKFIITVPLDAESGKPGVNET